VATALAALVVAGCEQSPEVARAANPRPLSPPAAPITEILPPDTTGLLGAGSEDAAYRGEASSAPGGDDATDAAARTSTGDGATGAGEASDAGAREVERVPGPDPRREFADARFPRPEHVRGLYVNAWGSGSNRRMSALLDIARETEVNTLVIDIKDATGYISHRTGVELANQIGATGEIRIADLPGLLDRLEAEGIYPIARIVIVKDPILAAYRPEYAIQDTAGGVWVDSKGITWLNPYSMDVWRYHVDLAREVAKMGFPEIQWDYVRFPDAPQSDLDRAVYLGSEGRSRSDAIRGFLEYARSNLADLPVRSTADVFGVTTSYNRDVGTGQVWEDVIDVVDAALPMVYPSHYWPGSFGYREPNGRPYEVVRRALEDAVRRSAAVEGAGLTRPWLQDFSLGQPIYAAAEVRAQIQATYDAGIEEWILWNPGGRYTVSALEPADGFDRDPLMRVAGVLAPVSRRYAVIDSIAALPVPTVPARIGNEEREPAPVDEPADSVRLDTVGSTSDAAADTLAVAAADTTRR
jgi:hypothetical protein